MTVKPVKQAVNDYYVPFPDLRFVTSKVLESIYPSQPDRVLSPTGWPVVFTYIMNESAVFGLMSDKMSGHSQKHLGGKLP